MTAPSHRCCFVPPYLLMRLAEHPDEHVAASARSTLSTDQEFRAGERVPTEPAPTPMGARVVEAGAEKPERTVSDAVGTTTLPGRVVRTEGDEPVSDPAVNEAYDGLGDTWQLYWTAYQRDSLDGAGLPLLATVHYGQDYDNAFFDGDRMVFGDGDGQVFNRFTLAVDVIGHELTHGVTQYTAALAYQGQSGALNESISDVFGSLVRQKALGQTAEQADWLIGVGLFTAAVQGDALRSMKAPGTAYDDDVLGKDPQPATMSGYVETTDDNGGVHLNSGIPNHAFYLAATAIGGRAWEGAGQIWYDVLTGPDIASDCDFVTFAQLTTAAAETRFGADSTQRQAVADAWAGVEVTTAAAHGGGTASAVPPATPAPSPADSSVPDEVTVIRSGGFAGLRMERTVQIAQLSPPDPQEWAGLFGSGTLESFTEGLGDTDIATAPMPDAFVYRVVAPETGLDVTAPAGGLPDGVRRLFDRALRGE